MKHYKVLLQDATLELAAHKLRTFLTLLGMIFGVGAVVAMLNIGEGAEREALKMIASMGVDNIIIQSKQVDEKELIELREESLGLSLQDAQAAVATLPFVTHYSASKKIKQYALYSDYAKSESPALGVTSDYFKHANLSLAQGRFLTNTDANNLSQVVVLGSEVATQLFPNETPLGKLIKLNHLWLKVVGVLKAPELDKQEFQGVSVGENAGRLFMPLTTSLFKLKHPALANEVDSVKLTIDGLDPRVAAKAIDTLLLMRHGYTKDYQLIVPAALLEQQRKTQDIFNIVMACVAGISLLVGGIGIMNIMLATVLERTKEIGLLRAVGATQQDIKHQFIAESFSISLIGAMLGVAFGLLLSELIGFYSQWAVSWSLQGIALSFAICIITGMVFGVFPAIKASKLNPIDALHSD